MSNSCCQKLQATIIKVADFEAGIVGLENVFRNVDRSGIEKEEEVANELIKWVVEFGNYVAPARRNEYKHALLYEYRKFLAKRKCPPQQ